MNKYSVLLLVPDFLAGTFGHDTYFAHVEAEDIGDAIDEAQEQAMIEYKSQDDGHGDGQVVELAGDRMVMTEHADGSVAFEFNDAGTGRVCGDCQLCCRLLPVKSIEKAAGEKCKHQKFGKGCAIYPHRPMDCRTWSCRWLADRETAGMPRPDRCHYVIDMQYDEIIQRFDSGAARSISVLQVWVDPAHRDAHRAPELRAYLLRMAEKYGVPAIIRYSSTDSFVLVAPVLNDKNVWAEIGAKYKSTEEMQTNLRELRRQA